MSSLTRFSMNGVILLPAMPASSASASAASMAAWTRAVRLRLRRDRHADEHAGGRAERGLRIGHRRRLCRILHARRRRASRRAREEGGELVGAEREHATPCVSRNSIVRGMSRIDLTPALTTMTGVRPSSHRSALTSIDASPPRWTPPMPPVTKMPMPAACASNIVHDTVVPPCAFMATARAESRRDTLPTAPSSPSFAKRSSSSSSRPMHADAVKHGDRRRRRARSARPPPPLSPSEVLWVWHAVRDDGRLERDDRTVVGDGVADVGADAEVGEVGRGGEGEQGEHFARPILRGRSSSQNAGAWRLPGALSAPTRKLLSLGLKKMRVR